MVRIIRGFLGWKWIVYIGRRSLSLEKYQQLVKSELRTLNVELMKPGWGLGGYSGAPLTSDMRAAGRGSETASLSVVK